MQERRPAGWSFYVVVLAPTIVLPVLTNALSDALTFLKGRLPLTVGLTAFTAFLLVRASRAEADRNVGHRVGREPDESRFAPEPLGTAATITQRPNAFSQPTTRVHASARNGRWHSEPAAVWDAIGSSALSVIVAVVLIVNPPNYDGVRAWWTGELYGLGYDGQH